MELNPIDTRVQRFVQQKLVALKYYQTYQNRNWFQMSRRRISLAIERPIPFFELEMVELMMQLQHIQAETTRLEQELRQARPVSEELDKKKEISITST